MLIIPSSVTNSTPFEHGLESQHTDPSFYQQHGDLSLGFSQPTYSQEPRNAGPLHHTTVNVQGQGSFDFTFRFSSNQPSQGDALHGLHGPPLVHAPYHPPNSYFVDRPFAPGAGHPYPRQPAPSIPTSWSSGEQHIEPNGWVPREAVSFPTNNSSEPLEHYIDQVQPHSFHRPLARSFQDRVATSYDGHIPRPSAPSPTLHQGRRRRGRNLPPLDMLSRGNAPVIRAPQHQNVQGYQPSPDYHPYPYGNIQIPPPPPMGNAFNRSHLPDNAVNRSLSMGMGTTIAHPDEVQRAVVPPPPVARTASMASASSSRTAIPLRRSSSIARTPSLANTLFYGTMDHWSNAAPSASTSYAAGPSSVAGPSTRSMSSHMNAPRHVPRTATMANTSSAMSDIPSDLAGPSSFPSTPSPASALSFRSTDSQYAAGPSRLPSNLTSPTSIAGSSNRDISNPNTPGYSTSLPPAVRLVRPSRDLATTPEVLAEGQAHTLGEDSLLPLVEHPHAQPTEEGNPGPWQCGWNGCSRLIPTLNDTDWTGHFHDAHPEVREDPSSRIPIQCLWEGCGRYLLKASMTKHIVKHGGKKIVCPICREALSPGNHNLARHRVGVTCKTIIARMKKLARDRDKEEVVVVVEEEEEEERPLKARKRRRKD